MDVETITERCLPLPLYTIRTSRREDTAKIAQLCRESGSFSEEEATSAGQDMDDYQHYFIHRDRVHVAEGPNGNLLGFIHYSPASITDGTWFIYWIAVAKPAQGMGLGRDLINLAESEIRQRRGRLLLVETSTSEGFTAARRLYTAMNFTLSATIPDYFAEGDHKNIYWKKIQRTTP